MTLNIKRFTFFLNRNPNAWFELWAQWDYHNYIASVTVLTFQIGYNWTWLKKKDIKKDSWQIVLDRG